MLLSLRKISLFILFVTLPFPSFGEECSLSRLWEKEGKKGQSTKVLILPVQIPKGASAGGTGRVLAVLLKEYLSHAKRLSLLPISSDPGVKADYTIRGELISEGNSYRFKGLLSSAADGTELLPFEGRFEFPETLNDLLSNFVEQVSTSLKSKLEGKKLLPFLNVSASSSAYLSYADGYMALEESLVVGAWRAMPLLQNAVRSFEQAIQEDYNYVPAYLGLAEALAALSALGTASVGVQNF